MTRIKTAHGVFTAWFSEHGLARLQFPVNGQLIARDMKKVRSLSMNRRSPSPPVGKRVGSLSPDVRHWHKLAAAALRRALKGEPLTQLPPLDLSAGTEFQQRVWSALQRIPPGETRTYSQVAIAIGKPKAVRAAGTACGANPVAIFVPCHRVVSSSGGLGGFSSELKWKRRLLLCEGVALELSKIN